MEKNRKIWLPGKKHLYGSQRCRHWKNRPTVNTGREMWSQWGPIYTGFTVMRDFTNNSLQCPIEIIISTKHVAIEGWRAVKFDKNIFCQFLLFNTWTIAQYLGNYHLTLLRGSYVCFSPILQKKKHLEARDFGTI